MRERCLQSLAILLAGLFSAERPRERLQAERRAAPGAPLGEQAAAPAKAQPFEN